MNFPHHMLSNYLISATKCKQCYCRCLNEHFFPKHNPNVHNHLIKLFNILSFLVY